MADLFESDLEWREEYRIARDATIEMLAARIQATEGQRSIPLFDRFRSAILNLDFGREVVFANLVRQYRKEYGITRRQFRDSLADGSFWEKFLEFLQSVDWEKVIELIIKLVEAILAIIAVV